MRPVIVEIARILLRAGLEAIGGAIATAKQPWYKVNLPGEKVRDTVLWKLRWHQDQLAKISGNPQVAYAAGDDLKNWTMRAYEEANAAEEGAAYLEKIWTEMWSEIQQKLAAMPRAALSAALSVASGTTQAVTGVPLWVWGAGAAALLGLVGYGAYKIASGPAGAALGGAVARRYLP